MIAREIRPSIGGGGYQRNKGTAGGKVRAISGKKSLVKGVEEGRYQRLEKRDAGRREQDGRRIVSALSGNAVNKKKRARCRAFASPFSLLPSLPLTREARESVIV